MQKTYDVCIVGAGPVGLMAAAVLAQQNISVFVVEKNTFHYAESEIQNGRPLSLNYSSISLLRDIGLWDTLKHLAEPIHTVEVSEEKRFGVVHLSRELCDLDALGYVVPYNALHDCLLKHVRSVCEVYEGKTVEALESLEEQDPFQYRVQVAGEMPHYEWVSVQLLVGADGRASSVRELIGCDLGLVKKQGYAFVGSAQCSRANNQIAYQRFTESGVWAFLPRGSGLRSWVLTLSDAKYAERENNSVSDWARDVQGAFGRRCGKIESVACYGSFPLQSYRMEKPFGKGYLLLGQAALSFLPIAAQGMNLSYQSVRFWRQALVLAKKQGVSLGDEAVLAHAWERWCTHENKMSHAISALYDLTHDKSRSMSCLRAFGLAVLDLVPYKKKIVENFAGLYALRQDELGEDYV